MDAPHHRDADVTVLAVVPPLAVGTAVAVTGLRCRPANAARRASALDTHRSHRSHVAAHRRLGVAVAAVTIAFLALFVGWVMTGLTAGLVIAASTRRRRAVSRRTEAALEAALPEAIELLVVCLGAGCTPVQAVEQLVDLAPPAIRPAFAAVGQRLHRGAGVADALTELTTHCGPRALPLVTTVATAVRDGLPLAPVLDRLTDDARAGRRRHGEAAARRLPVRLAFPLVVCTLPSFVLLAIAPAVLGALSTVRGSTP